MSREKIFLLKAQYWPYASRASVVVLVFTRARRPLLLKSSILATKKASEFSTSQKWPPRDRSVQCSMGNTGSLSQIINPSLTKFFRSRWLDIDLVLFCEVKDLDFVSVHKYAKKNLANIQPCWPRAWSITYMYGLRIEQSGFEPWPGTLCCVLGQDTLLSQCLFPPRCINGYWKKNRLVTCIRVVSLYWDQQYWIVTSWYRNQSSRPVQR